MGKIMIQGHLKERFDKFAHLLKKYSTDILLGMIPIVLAALLVLIYRFNVITQQQIATLQFASQLSVNPSSPYPVLKNPYNPFLTSESAIIMDEDSHVILYSKNPTLRFSMASTTKIMTALVALGHYKSQDVLTIYSDDIEGAEVGFITGQQVYFLDVLYGMMLPSGNDAAYAIAENYPGGVEVFVKKMNDKAKELQLRSTHYADPAGLNDDQNYTTAHDLARLTAVALKNPTFREVTGTRNRVITTVDGQRTYTLSNLNRLLGSYGVTGVKTGFTQGAGGVLVTAKEENGKRFIIAVIKSEDRFLDTITLLRYLDKNVSYTNFSYP